MSAARVLYDLAAENADIRFSPYCWRTKMALRHKGLAFDTVPWRFIDKPQIAFSGQGRVPVLVDGAQVVVDSWAIAQYLEQNYSELPSLFGGSAAMSVTRLVNDWLDRSIHVLIAPMIVLDIVKLLDADSARYFRSSREKNFGATLEQLASQREQQVLNLRKALEPLRNVLRHQTYLGGATPTYADYIPFGSLQWARCVSAFELLTPDDPIHPWFERLLDHFDGMGRRAVLAR